MRWVCSLVLAILTIPAGARAIRDCPSCVLGLWDDAALTQSFGTLAPFTLKQFYLGTKLSAEEPGLTGIEFSISGWDPQVLALQLMESVTSPPANIMMNLPMAPVDTTQTGGMNVAWPACIVGSQALLRFTVVWMNPVPPVNLVLQVRHRYPPSNTRYGLAGPVLVDCTQPPPEGWIAVRIAGGSYVFNPVVQAEGRTWGVVKGLYR